MGGIININHNSFINTVTDTCNAIYLNNVRMNTGIIEWNTISNIPTSTSVGVNLIAVESPTANPQSIKIRNNTITLHGRDIYMLNCRRLLVSVNTCNVNTNLPLQGTSHYGILCEYGNNNRIWGNNCFASPNNNNYTNNLQVRGIQVKQSPSVIVECNNVQRHGRSMVFDGVCSPSTVFYNTMQFGVRGLVLSGTGIIGNQGSATSPSGNYWPNNGLVTNTFGIQPIGGECVVELGPLVPLSSLFIYLPENFVGSQYRPDPNFALSGFSMGLPNSSNPRNTTYCSTPPLIMAPQNKVGELLKIAQNQYQFQSNIEENKWFVKSILYEELEKDPVLRQSEPAFIHQYDSLYQTNIDDFNRIRIAYDAGNISQATSFNSLIIPTNQVESNLKDVYEIFFNTYGIDTLALNSVQISTLIEVANLCPEVGGVGVYIARGMLSMQRNYGPWPEECGGSSPRLSQPALNEFQQEEYTCILYPNPANSKINLQVISTDELELGSIESEIVITNSIGIEMFKGSIQINGDSNEVEISSWADGIYLIKFSIDGEIIGTSRLSVVK